MQAIVADTSPLKYLVLIQAADILPSLYRRVLIPPAVSAELAHANTPTAVHAWISQPPQWLEVVGLKRPVDPALAHLDAGEREAISPASELQAILLLMDAVTAEVASSSLAAECRDRIQSNAGIAATLVAKIYIRCLHAGDLARKTRCAGCGFGARL
jgi:predicted nucleic acid-binding protein